MRDDVVHTKQPIGKALGVSASLGKTDVCAFVCVCVCCVCAGFCVFNLEVELCMMMQSTPCTPHVNM